MYCAVLLPRLRVRLLKMGCITAQAGMLGEKTLSVLRLIKPYRPHMAAVLDSDDDREAAAGEGDDGDEEDEEAAVTQDAALDSGSSEVARGGPVAEVARRTQLLEIICAV